MLTTVLDPVRLTNPDPAPPWGWNPAATFLTAYNAQAQERRKQEEFKMAMEMERILFPAKAAKAEFEINQLAYETEVMANAYKLQNESISERRRILRSGGSGGSSASSNVAGNGGPGNPQQSNTIDWNSYGKTNQSDDSVLLE